MTGPAHPALLAARLYGTRLGDWASAAACARGLLDVRVDVPMQPLVRIEALRLLSRALLAGGESPDAAEGARAALEQAATEAVEVGYAWMELLALRDLRALDDGGARRRLDEALDRLGPLRADAAAALGVGS